MKYFEFGNRLVGHGPYLHSKVKLHSFGLEADKARIQLLLDRMFAEPSGGEMHYRALSSKIFVTFANIGEVRSDTEPNRGFLPEVDVAMWIIAMRKNNPLRLRWIPVYLFVDSAPAMGAGREVYGFPKQIGRFEIPGHAPADERFSATTYVIPSYGAQSTGSWEPVLEFEPDRGVLAATDASPAEDATRATDASPEWQDAKQGFTAFQQRFLPDIPEEDDEVVSSLGAALKLKVTMAFLKQFPEIHDTRLACYQSIIEASASVEGWRRGGFTESRFRGRALSYSTHPFLEELGLAPDWQDVGRGMWVDYDFRMHLGNTVWRA